MTIYTEDIGNTVETDTRLNTEYGVEISSGIGLSQIQHQPYELMQAISLLQQAIPTEVGEPENEFEISQSLDVLKSLLQELVSAIEISNSVDRNIVRTYAIGNEAILSVYAAIVQEVSNVVELSSSIIAIPVINRLVAHTVELSGYFDIITDIENEVELSQTISTIKANIAVLAQTVELTVDLAYEYGERGLINTVEMSSDITYFTSKLLAHTIDIGHTLFRNIVSNNLIGNDVVLSNLVSGWKVDPIRGGGSNYSSNMYNYKEA